MNPSPFFYPFAGLEQKDNNYDKLINKIERLEKNLRVIENRLNKLENNDKNKVIINEPTDMYMI